MRIVNAVYFCRHDPQLKKQRKVLGLKQEEGIYNKPSPQRRKPHGKSKSKKQQHFRDIAYVKLNDVFRELPQVKIKEEPVTQEAFMGELGLAQTASPEELTTNTSPKTAIHPTIKFNNGLNGRIPFSSDYGRHIVKRDRHFVPDCVTHRRLERLEWNLRECETPPPPRNAIGDYEVTYEPKKREYVRNYRFPKRQFWQKAWGVKEQFARYLCRPVTVEVERMDLEKARDEIKRGGVVVHQQLTVVIKPICRVRSNGVLKRRSLRCIAVNM